jgi:hypothetical protein
MQQLPAYLALARPFSVSGTKDVEQAIKTRLPVEVRIGAGPTSAIPARVLGYCECAADAIKIIERALGRPVRVHLFSSAPKIAALAGTDPGLQKYLPALVALAGGLRLAGFKGGLSVDVACGWRELTDDLMGSALHVSIRSFLDRAAKGNANGADPISYAVEHSSPSMYGDILEPEESRILRITVGAKAEARFWAIRQRVMIQAAMNGLRVVPTFGMILRTLARPWYSLESREPLLTDLPTQGPARVVEDLHLSYHPSYGGNVGLRREARNAARLVTQAMPLAEAVSTVSSARRFLKGFDGLIGRRLSESMALLEGQ